MTFYLNDKVRATAFHVGFNGNIEGRTGQIVGSERADSGAMFYFVDFGSDEGIIKLHETELERA